MIDESWPLRGACRGQRPHTFIPDDSGDRNVTAEQHGQALRFCENCCVVSECLEFAIETNQQLGVWGGTTPRQRRTIREARQREAANVQRS